MENRSNTEITCIFCGQNRTVTNYSEDGKDWMGHARGTSRSWNDDKGCNCELGKIAFIKTKIKEMCLNCRYYMDGCCTNEKELNKVSTMFDVGSSLTVKTPTKKCEYYDLSTDIFKRLIIRD